MTIWNSPAKQAVADLAGSMRIAECVRAITLHGIPDLMAAEPKESAELAGLAGLDPLSLDRVLRFLSDEGLVARNEAGRYANTEISDLLRRDVPDSLRTYVLFRTDDSMISAWMGLADTLVSGKSAFEAANGMPIFGYLKENPEIARLFNELMHDFYGGEGENIARGFDFGRFRSVVDVGGGLGHVLARILLAHPGLAGTLYDVSAVAEAAASFLADRGLSQRAEIIDGDFFDDVPEGHDAYFLKSVIHDWTDEEAARILGNCRRVMAVGGRVLIAEQVPATTRDLYPDRFIDLEMMVLTGGIERSLEQFEAVLASSGLALVACHSIPDSPYKILEAAPA